MKISGRSRAVGPPERHRERMQDLFSVHLTPRNRPVTGDILRPQLNEDRSKRVMQDDTEIGGPPLQERRCALAIVAEPTSHMWLVPRVLFGNTENSWHVNSLPTVTPFWSAPLRADSFRLRV